MTIKEGDKVKIEYTGTLDDGMVFDSSEKHKKPLEFEVGSKQVIKGFEEAVKGMTKDEEKEVKLQPLDAYGDLNPELIKKVSKEQLPTDKELKPGIILLASLPNGTQLPCKVTEVEDKEVTLDMNHPLAGKKLNFKIKVVEISV